MDSIFKAYDIRGKYPTEINEELAFKIGKAFATFINKNTIVVGGDSRLSTPSLKTNFIQGVLSTGTNVVDIGLVPTPMSYFACYKLGYEASAMITASHLSKNFNGIKFYGNNVQIGFENGLNKVKEIIENGNYKNGEGTLTSKDISEEYVEFMKSLINLNLENVKIVVDGSNGSAGYIYARTLKSLGAEVIEIFCEPDGNFPNHDPDPLVEENLKDIKEKVKEVKADIGLAYDGDGDRVAIISEEGEKINPNHVLCLIVENVLQKEKGSIVFDVLSSKLVENVIKQNQGIPVISPVGHTNIAKKCYETNALVAGEVSGHYYFKETNYVEDTLLASLKILELMKKSNKKISELVKKYPKFYQVLDKRIPIVEEKKFDFIENIKKRLKNEGFDITEIDGVKINFNNGWLLVRASNTEPKIVIGYESSDFEEFKHIESLAEDIIKSIPS